MYDVASVINYGSDTDSYVSPQLVDSIYCIQHKGVTITPEAGFAIKTKALLAGSKVFINLCTHEEIEAPSLKKKLNDDGESVEGILYH